MKNKTSNGQEQSALAAATLLERISEQPELLEIARKKLEDVLVEFRDSRISTFRGNGLAIRERDGRESGVIRLGSEDAMAIGLKAIAAHLRSNAKAEAPSLSEVDPPAAG